MARFLPRNQLSFLRGYGTVSGRAYPCSLRTIKNQWCHHVEWAFDALMDANYNWEAK